MKILDWAEEKVQKLSIWEFGVLKIALVLFGMIIGVFTAGFVGRYIWHFIGIWAVTYIWIMWRVFRK